MLVPHNDSYRELETDEYQVRVGSVSIRKEDGTVLDVKRGIIHKDLRLVKNVDEGKEDNYDDLALIKLRNDVKNVEVIEMFEDGEEIKSPTVAKIAGWGSVSNNRYYDLKTKRWETGTEPLKFPKKLQYVEVAVLDNKICRGHHIYNIIMRVLPENQICAIGSKGAGVFEGDSGGPLVIDKKLAGILNMGLQDYTGNMNIIAIYSSISHYRKWIDEKIKK